MTAAPVRTPRRSRDDVVRSACRLFAERGFHGTSMRDLGDSLGLLGSSLYTHIGSKAELLVEIIGEGAGLFQALVEQVEVAGGPPRAQVQALISGHIQILTDDLDRASTYLNEARHLPEEQRAHVVALRDRYQDAVRALLERGVQAGELRRDLDPHYAATFVLSTLNALPRWYDPNGPDGPATVAEGLIKFIMEGITA